MPVPGSAEVYTDLRQRVLAGGGRTITLPPGTYMVELDKGGTGVSLDVPGTVLDLSQGAVVKIAGTEKPGYNIVRIQAPDCVVRGGAVVGDVEHHVGDTGEWGFGVRVHKGGDRALIDSVTAVGCWGGGIYVDGNPDSVEIRNCRSFGHRRNGLTISHASRALVSGGMFGWTHTVRSTAPQAGIDLETHGNQRIVDALVHDVTVAGCLGHGLLVIGSVDPVGVGVEGLSASGNDVGVTIGGSLVTASVKSSRSLQNARYGFQSIAEATTDFDACASSHNGVSGFYLASPACVVRNCTSNNDGVDPTSALLVDPSAQGQAQVIDSHGTGH